MKKVIFFFGCLLACSFQMNAQWAGSSSEVGGISRTGKVAIGASTFDSESKLTVTGAVNIGGEESSKLKVRHINGKEANSNLEDNLYLNWNNDKDVHVGRYANPSTLYVHGKIGIGIGSMPSAYKLAIDGKAICEELKVELSQNWPDYVFTNSYQLKPLAEVEAHIQAKGHLPNTPSAKEIEAENGFEVGEMTVNQQEKIEEIFLHLIEMKKEIEKLKKENVELKKQITSNKK